MVTLTPINAQNEKELLFELARHVHEPEMPDFSRIGDRSVYNLPLLSDRPVVLGGYNYTRNGGVIRGLTLPQQFETIKQLSERFGIPLSHNPLKTNYYASFLPEGRIYRDNVLSPYWVFTGEMIRELPEGHTVHRVNGIDILTLVPQTSTDHLAVEGERQDTETRKIRRYNSRSVLQREIPAGTGYFSDFDGVIPKDRELILQRPESGKRGYWNGVYPDKNGLSAVRCVWGSDDGGLVAGACWPLVRGDGGVLGIGTDAPLNKQI